MLEKEKPQVTLHERVSAMDVHPVAAVIAGVSPTPGRIVISLRPPAHATPTVSALA